MLYFFWKNKTKEGEIENCNRMLWSTNTAFKVEHGLIKTSGTQTERTKKNHGLLVEWNFFIRLLLHKKQVLFFGPKQHRIKRPEVLKINHLKNCWKTFNMICFWTMVPSLSNKYHTRFLSHLSCTLSNNLYFARIHSTSRAVSS